MVDGAPGAQAVIVDHLVARQHAGQMRGLAARGARQRVVVGLDPVGERRPQIHERAAQRRHLPVEHPEHAGRVLGIEHAVVEAEIVVDDAGGGILRHVVGEPARDVGEARHVPGAGARVALGPALDLAAHVAGTLAQIAQAGGIDVHRVQRHQLVDDGQTERAGGRLVEMHAARHAGARDQPAQPLHDVELAADDGVVVAVGDHLGHMGKCGSEPRLHPVLAPHVVRRRGLGARGRAAQDEVVGAVCQPVGPVGCAAAVLGDLGRSLQTVDACPQPLVDRRDVQFLPVADVARGVDNRLVHW